MRLREGPVFLTGAAGPGREPRRLSPGAAGLAGSRQRALVPGRSGSLPVPRARGGRTDPHRGPGSLQGAVPSFGDVPSPATKNVVGHETLVGHGDLTGLGPSPGRVLTGHRFSPGLRRAGRTEPGRGPASGAALCRVRCPRSAQGPRRAQAITTPCPRRAQPATTPGPHRALALTWAGALGRTDPASGRCGGPSGRHRAAPAGRAKPDQEGQARATDQTDQNASTARRASGSRTPQPISSSVSSVGDLS